MKVVEPSSVQIKTRPNLSALNGRLVAVDPIRSLTVEDLLARTPVGLDNGPVKALITGRRVLVTGAGGSIGRRRVARLRSLI